MSDDDYRDFIEKIHENQLADVKAILHGNPQLLISFHPIHKPLIIASERGLNDMIELFISIDQTIIDLFSRKGYTALHVASKKGHASTVELLIRLGSKVIDIYGGRLIALKTPIYLAVKHRHIHVVETLMQNGCKSIDKPCLGLTPLAYAASEGFLAGVKTLVQLGSKAIDSSDFACGYTPMHFAVLKGHIPMIELLVRLGSTSLNTVARNGQRLMGLAAATTKSPIELIETLYCLGENANRTLLYNAIRCNSNDAISTFIRLGLCHVDDHPGDNDTHINVSLQCGSHITELLIALGADYTGVFLLHSNRFEKIVAELTEDRLIELRHQVYFQRSLTNRLLLEEARSRAILQRPCQRI